MIVFKHTGSFKKTEAMFKASKKSYKSILAKYGREGVRALSQATPKDTGVTAASWNYSIEEKNGSISIYWTNSNVVKGVPIAIILQYGHGTRNGGYVKGRDYINPALRPVFDEMADKVWKEVTAK